jgi:predicted HicB family RNase H-like nuclease
MATETLYLRVDPELDKELRNEAERREISLTALCIEFLAAGLKKVRR